jgi:hypothetical protein
MKMIVVTAMAAFLIFSALTGCNEDEKQSGKDALRDFLAEEDAKARDRHKDFMRGWGEGKSYPSNPFGNDPKPATPPPSSANPSNEPGDSQPPVAPAPSHPAQQER